MESVYMSARVKAFAAEGVRWNQVVVDLVDQSVRVWDEVAQHYTRCHSLSDRCRQTLVRRARERLLARSVGR